MNDPATWDKLSPDLDEALAHLTQADRDLVLLRYLKGMDLSEGGANQWYFNGRSAESASIAPFRSLGTVWARPCRR